jgi:hypothetical protein
LVKHLPAVVFRLGQPHTRLLAQGWGRADAPGAFLTTVPISFGWQTRRTSPRAVTVQPRRAPLR